MDDAATSHAGHAGYYRGIAAVVPGVPERALGEPALILPTTNVACYAFEKPISL